MRAGTPTCPQSGQWTAAMIKDPCDDDDSENDDDDDDDDNDYDDAPKYDDTVLPFTVRSMR